MQHLDAMGFSGGIRSRETLAARLDLPLKEEGCGELLLKEERGMNWIDEYPELARRLQAALPTCTEDQVQKMIEVVMNICTVCWEADAGCKCWNDE